LLRSRPADLCGPEWRDKAIALLRGACVHYAPKNAASFLVSRACKLSAAEFGWRAFSAYADAAASEVGAIYQACNWLYLGVSVGRTANGLDRWRYYCRKTGRWHSEWMLRQRGIRAQPLRCDPGWKAERLRDKHRYVHFEGSRRERRAASAALKYEPRPYPKRRAAGTWGGPPRANRGGRRDGGGQRPKGVWRQCPRGLDLRSDCQRARTDRPASR
jgi:hypothetical protein